MPNSLNTSCPLRFYNDENFALDLYYKDLYGDPRDRGPFTLAKKGSTGDYCEKELSILSSMISVLWWTKAENHADHPRTKYTSLVADAQPIHVSAGPASSAPPTKRD